MAPQLRTLNIPHTSVLHCQQPWTGLNTWPYLAQKSTNALGFWDWKRHLLPQSARHLFYNCLVLTLFDYGDLVWVDKDNIVLMESLQILQNKAAKTILDRSPLLSASDALNTLGWRKLALRWWYHRCVHIFKCNKLCTSTLNKTHNYNTRKKKLRLPKVKRNWEKRRLAYHTVKDWNALYYKLESCKTKKEFKSNFYKHFWYLIICFKPFKFY